MSLQELKKQACQLPANERLESLQDFPSQQPERSRIIKQMKGLLKTNQPAPTDEQVKAMLEKRREEKYL